MLSADRVVGCSVYEEVESEENDMIVKEHENNCERCDQLAREAQRTAEELGRYAWLSLDEPGRCTALYTADTEEEN